MQEIITRQDLSNAITLLETERYHAGVQLKQEAVLAYERLIGGVLTKPAGVANAFMSQGLLGSGAGIVLGYLVNRMLIGTSPGIIRKIIGLLLQFGVARVVSDRINILPVAGNFLLSLFRRK